MHELNKDVWLPSSTQRETSRLATISKHPKTPSPAQTESWTRRLNRDAERIGEMEEVALVVRPSCKV
ncbi:hypothetical protein BC629DRAFT_1503826 [Irpex lacteus]|nr:hypothetical protein BC629DRAFT_1503826 [Irpex lacteus]